MFTRRIIQKPFALLIALMLLIAPAGLAIDVHLCKGSIKSISFFGTAQDCTIDEVEVIQCSATPKKTEKTTQIGKTPCCSNHSYFSKANINTTIGTAGSAVNNFVALVYTFSSPQVFAVEASYLVKHPISPPIASSTNRSVLYQTFRI